MKNIFTLNSKVSIYVPSTVGVNGADQDNLQEQFTNEVLREFSNMFGGATMTKARGAWVAADNELVEEGVNVVYSFCTESAFERFTDKIVKLAKRICKVMKQEAVTLEYNNKVAFISND